MLLKIIFQGIIVLLVGISSMNIYAGGGGNHCNPNGTIRIHNQCSWNSGLAVTLTGVPNYPPCCGNGEGPKGISHNGSNTFSIISGCTYQVAGINVSVPTITVSDGNSVYLRGNFVTFQCEPHVE